MKKTLSILTALLLIAALSACGSPPAAAPEATASPVLTAPPTSAAQDWSALPSSRYAQAVRDGKYYYAYKTRVGGEIASGWSAGDGADMGVSLTTAAGETRELLLSGVDYRIDMKALLCVKTKPAASPEEAVMTYLGSGAGTVDHPDWETPRECAYDSYALDAAGATWQMFFTGEDGDLTAIVTVGAGESVSTLYITAGSFTETLPEGILALPQGLTVLDENAE